MLFLRVKTKFYNRIKLKKKLKKNFLKNYMKNKNIKIKLTKKTSIFIM